eukprot:1814961-Pleurochrysis_carterae.AAC.3
MTGSQTCLESTVIRAELIVLVHWLPTRYAARLVLRRRHRKQAGARSRTNSSSPSQERVPAAALAHAAESRLIVASASLTRDTTGLFVASRTFLVSGAGR